MKEHPVRYRIVTHLMLIGATLFWGLNPMLMKIGLRELSPLHFNLFRLIVALAITLPIVYLQRGFRRIRKADLPRFAAVSVFGFSLFQIGYTFGVHYTSASVSAIILGLLPIAVVVINRLTGRRDLTKLKIIGVAGTVAGVAFIAAGRYGGLSLADTYLEGVLILVVAEAAYGSYTVFVKPLTDRYSVSLIIAVVITVSIFVFAVFSIPTIGTVSLRELSPATYLVLIASGFLALSAGNMLWSGGVKRIGSVNTSVYGNLPPVFGVAAGILILGETLTGLQIAGALVILTGVFLVNSRAAEKEAAGDGAAEGAQKSAAGAAGPAGTEEPN
mgnify:CR=1 FL=1